MTRRLTAIPLAFVVLMAGSVLGQTVQPPAQLPPGTIVTPGAVFVPAAGQGAGGRVPGVPLTTPQMPARDVAGPAAQTGTGIIRGRVTEAETGRPIRRAVIQLTARTAAREPRVTSTNDEGRFEIRELPAAEFMLSVRKPGYVNTGYGVRSEMDGPRPIRLADGGVFDKADVALERGGVITGRVTDDYGEPVLDAGVRVMQRRYVQGKARLMPLGTGTETNDIGEYRVFGLAPGDYYVTAALRADFFRSQSDDAMGYAMSYYPGTTDVASAQSVRVAVGSQTQADIALQPVKLGRILGLLQDASGRPVASGRVMGRRIDDTAMFAVMDGGTSATVKPDGTFMINSVVPGRYALQGMSGAMFSVGTGVTDVADATVDVTPGEVSTVTMAISKGGTIRGRVVVDGTPINSLTSLNVMASPVDQGGFFMGARPSPVAADGTFEIVAVRGPVLLRLIGSEGGVVIKSVLNGVSDVTLDGINPAGKVVSGVEIHVTKDVGELSGTVTGSRGETLTNYAVVVFHDDQRRWFAIAGRGTAIARPDQAGAFTVTGLLPGTYHVVALPEFDSGTIGDPAVMEHLRGMATQVTLGEAEKRALTLRLVAQ